MTTLPLEAVASQFRGYAIVLRLEFRLDRGSGWCDLEIELAKTEQEGAATVIVEFFDVSGLPLGDFGGGVTQLLFLQLTDISDQQLDRRSIRVEEVKRNSINFRCHEVLVETLYDTTVGSFLRRFERFDGAIIQRIEVKFREEAVEFDLTAFDTASSGGEGRVTVCLRLNRMHEFRFRESVKESGVQLDDHLEAIWLDGAVFLILDPLQARDFDQGAWTIDQVRRSQWYAGGESLSWELLPYETDRR